MSKTRKPPLTPEQSLSACTRLVIGCLSLPWRPTSVRELVSKEEHEFLNNEVSCFEQKQKLENENQQFLDSFSKL